MKTKEFLARLNTATKGWGVWINKNNPDENHVGQYTYENDCLPKSFVYAGSLEELAHLRQQYILNASIASKTDEELGKEWAENFLDGWQIQT
ncbi:hypothetical protein PCC7424_3145 [Gloeothece citriformis PCC 7424]|uniref:Uncharacterized protein n=1 Tax=Gloeothece citriformis (strain PCC 7424) TaxID=65393 RepID=B7KCJ6_GLOC7|nr:hypothetical protein [Gloeothece citriformis]ACK71547.1 hypothetical protein PCC7424_3145 [Gloeothece citriformis PCC 7424]